MTKVKTKNDLIKSSIIKNMNKMKLEEWKLQNQAIVKDPDYVARAQSVDCNESIDKYLSAQEILRGETI
jgi:hypothetical protein